MLNHPLLIAVALIGLVLVYYLYLQPKVAASKAATSGPAIEARTGRGHF